MNMLVHTLHVILAGVWLGGVVFTTVVVSPALKEMKWSEAERVRVRSVIGKQYARVGTVNLVLLLIFAFLDGLLKGFGAALYVEYVLLIVVFSLVGAHGAYSRADSWGWPKPSGAPGAPRRLAPLPKSATRSRGSRCAYPRLMLWSAWQSWLSLSTRREYETAQALANVNQLGEDG